MIYITLSTLPKMQSIYNRLEISSSMACVIYGGMLVLIFFGGGGGGSFNGR